MDSGPRVLDDATLEEKIDVESGAVWHSVHPEEGGITNYQEERARRLEHVLAKEHQVTHIHAYYLSEGQVTAVSWPNDEGGRSSVRLNAAMVAALRGIAVTLIADLKRTGADARALHLVEQHRQRDAAWSQQYEPGVSRESQRGASSSGLDHDHS